MSDLLELPSGEAFVLVDGLSLGRHPLADVRLDDASVSREHARVTGVPGRWLVQDLHSRNGTWVNDRRLTSGGSHPLRHGDHLRLGRLVALVHLETSDELDVTTGLQASTLARRLPLTAYQLDVLRLLCEPDEPAEPMTNADIAARLGTPGAVDAVKAALSRVYARAGLADVPSVGKRRELRRRALDSGWLE